MTQRNLLPLVEDPEPFGSELKAELLVAGTGEGKCKKYRLSNVSVCLFAF